MIDDAKSAWLIAQFGNDGNLDSRADLLLLVALLERASAVDARLRAYAITQVERTVITGEGSTRIGAALRPGIIDEAEVALLRRAFQAAQSEHATGISVSEAQSLFRIKAATIGQDNAAGWQLLFVQLVGQFLIEGPARRHYRTATSTPVPVRRRSNARRQRVSRSPRSGTRDTSNSVSEAAPITGDEAAWLKAEIVADGTIDPIEKALLAFILDEAAPLPADVATLTESPTALSA